MMIPFLLTLVFSLSAFANPVAPQCKNQAIMTVRKILSLQETKKMIVEVKVLKATVEDDGNYVYETYLVQGYVQEKFNKVPVRVPSEITFIPEHKGCVMIDYSLPGAG